MHEGSQRRKPTVGFQALVRKLRRPLIATNTARSRSFALLCSPTMLRPSMISVARPVWFSERRTTYRGGIAQCAASVWNGIAARPWMALWECGRAFSWDTTRRCSRSGPPRRDERARPRVWPRDLNSAIEPVVKTDHPRSRTLPRRSRIAIYEQRRAHFRGSTPIWRIAALVRCSISQHRCNDASQYDPPEVRVVRLMIARLNESVSQ